MRSITVLLFVAALGVAGKATAQPLVNDEPTLAVRPFALAASEQFSAQKTFDAVFGSARGIFWGGGLDLAHRSGLFADVTVSRFSKSGQRAFDLAGRIFPLGVPLDATLTPIEVTLGYRFRLGADGRIRPYAGVGVGSYLYKETSSFADAGDNVDTRHTGFLAVGGAEVRVHRWVGVSVDVQYTSVTGILGEGGLSKDLNEDNLGGIAARFRVIVGR